MGLSYTSVNSTRLCEKHLFEFAPRKSYADRRNDDIQLVALDEATGEMDLELQDEIMQLAPNSLILIVSWTQLYQVH